VPFRVGQQVAEAEEVGVDTRREPIELNGHVSSSLS
jgi:hypothetical protein